MEYAYIAEVIQGVEFRGKPAVNTKELLVHDGG